MTAPVITAERPHAQPDMDTGGNTMLPLTVRLKDGRELDTERTAEQHRQIHLAFLHAASNGYVEVAAGHRNEAGELHIYTRRRRDHFLPAGGGGDPEWHEKPLTLAETYVRAGRELFLGVAPRMQRRGSKQAVQFSQWLWLDIDGPEHLGRLQALLERKPAHLLVESAGSGGMHAYWRVTEPIAARKIRTPDGRLVVNPLEVRQPTPVKGRTRLVGYRELGAKEVITVARKVDPIQRANLRLIHALGYHRGTHVADKQCHEQARLLRWAGSRNGKTGEWARIMRLDLWLPSYSPDVLVGDLADPPRTRPVQRRDLTRQKYDAYKLIPAPWYFARLANVQLPERGNINCPSPLHEDVVASMSVDAYVFCCHGCGAHGTIYDLASLMNHGPTGDALADDKRAFGRAKQTVTDACSDLL